MATESTVDHDQSTAIESTNKTSIETSIEKSIETPNKRTGHADFPIPDPVLEEFKKKVYGQVVCPWDVDYVKARTDVNLAYSSMPKLVVFCVCLQDVRACLALAGTYKIAAVARSGRHSLAGYSGNDGIVIDTSAMNSVVVNYADKTAVVGPGTQFGMLNACLQSYGLHVPGGGCPTVAVAGYMQGGGYGFTSREFGIHCDNVLSFKMVLANQRVVEANASQNADLFWAVRGGTGNQFGILLEVRYQLYELGDVSGVRLNWSLDEHPAEAARALLAIQEHYINSEQVNHLGFQTAISSSRDGTSLNFCGIFNGSDDQLDEVLRPLTDIDGCKTVMRLRGQYSTVDETLLERIPDITSPMKAMTQSRYIDRNLTVDEYRKIIDFALTYPARLMIIDMEGYGGKIASVEPDAMAFMHRNVKFDLFCDVFWAPSESGDEQVNWLQGLMEVVDDLSNGHSYQNYPCRLQTDWRWAYFGKYFNTLLWVKQKFDPNNFFNFEQSISPPPDNQPEREYAALLFDDKKIVYEPY